MAWFLNVAGGYFKFTTLASPSSGTGALKRTNSVDTFAIIEARCVGTVANVSFTIGTRVAFTTHTFVFVIKVKASLSARWVTGVAKALINFSLTLKTHETGSTLASESVNQIHAGGAILTRLALAIIDCVLTVLAGVS